MSMVLFCSSYANIIIHNNTAYYTSLAVVNPTDTEVRKPIVLAPHETELRITTIPPQSSLLITIYRNQQATDYYCKFTIPPHNLDEAHQDYELSIAAREPSVDEQARAVEYTLCNLKAFSLEITEIPSQKKIVFNGCHGEHDFSHDHSSW